MVIYKWSILRFIHKINKNLDNPRPFWWRACRIYFSGYNRLCIIITKYQSTNNILEQSAMALGTRQTMTAVGTTSPRAVSPQLFSVDEIRPNVIPQGKKRRACMRLTKSSVFAGTDKWLPVFALNGCTRVQLTLDSADNVVKRNDPTWGKQSVKFFPTGSCGVAVGRCDT